MYKCSDCGQEYKTKPEYCDCGNDTFIEIVAEKKPSIFERYELSPYALCFFIGCIILSILTILFFANPKPQTQATKQQVAKPIAQKIPDIDSFWDNTPVKTVTKEEPIEAEQPILQKIFQPKPVEKPVKTTVAKKEIKQTAKPAEKPVTKPQPTKQEVKPQPKTEVKTPAKPATNVNSQAVMNYKLRLRNALFSRLDCVKVQGSGKCGIQFAVDSNGKLINRAFTFQSDNKTLNDEVYKMLMRMPTFDTPPSEYKGELIKLTFEFDNGSYEINLIK